MYFCKSTKRFKKTPGVTVFVICWVFQNSSAAEVFWSFADSETSKNKHTDMLICQRYPKTFSFSYSKTEM